MLLSGFGNETYTEASKNRQIEKEEIYSITYGEVR